MEKIFYAGIELTNKCNLGCKWCYDDSHKENSNVMSLNEVKRAIEKLKELGVEIINFTGREATLRNDLIEIIKYAKKLNLKIILTTNGLNLLNPHKKVLEDIDYLSIPLDSNNPKKADMIRCSLTGEPSSHFERIMEILDYIKKHKFNSKLKINTIVEKRNLDEISLIGKLIFCDIWKIVEVQKQGDAIKNWNIVSITNEQYLKAVEEVLKMQKEGKYLNIKKIIVKKYKKENKNIYPLPIINTSGELYFPAERNINTSININDNNFVKKVNQFLKQHKRFNEMNRKLFNEHYGENY